LLEKAYKDTVYIKDAQSDSPMPSASNLWRERTIRHFLKSVEKSSKQPSNTLTQLSLHNWKLRYERNRYLVIDNKSKGSEGRKKVQASMLFIRLDQALDLLRHDIS